MRLIKSILICLLLFGNCAYAEESFGTKFFADKISKYYVILPKNLDVMSELIEFNVSTKGNLRIDEKLSISIPDLNLKSEVRRDVLVQFNPAEINIHSSKMSLNEFSNHSVKGKHSQLWSGTWEGRPIIYIKIIK